MSLSFCKIVDWAGNVFVFRSTDLQFVGYVGIKLLRAKVVTYTY